MNYLTCRAVYKLRNGVFLQSCHYIAGRRLPRSARTFRTTARASTSHSNRPDPLAPVWNPVSDSLVTPEAKDDSTGFSDITDVSTVPSDRPQESRDVPDDIEKAADRLNKPKDKSTYGSASKRARRGARRPEDENQIPDATRFTVPTWFLERNVWLYEDGRDRQERRLLTQPPSKAVNTSSPISDPNNTPGVISEQANDIYMIDHDVLEEISLMVAAGLRPASIQHADSYAASKPHLLLQSPKDGGIFFLDTVVKHVASQRAADVITIDAQDIAELAAEYGGDLTDMATSSVRSLGYDTHLLMTRQDDQTAYERGEEDDYDDNGEAIDQQTRNNAPNHVPQHRVTVLPIITLLGTVKVADFLNSAKSLSTPQVTDASTSPVDSNQQPMSPQSKQITDDNARTFILLEAFLDAARAKRKRSPTHELHDAGIRLEHLDTLEPSKHLDSEDSNVRDSNQTITHDLIVQIQDYAEINASPSGGRLLSMLHEVVTKRRKIGQRILIMGTTSSEDLIPSLSKSGFQSLQMASGQGPYRVIVTPCRSLYADGIFAGDQRERTRQINTRHLQDMIRRVAPSVEHVQSIVSDSKLVVGTATVFASGLDESVWSFERVHRATTIILGTLDEGDELSVHHITRGLAALLSSDSAKDGWIDQEREDGRRYRSHVTTSDTASDINKKPDDRLKKLRKNCNSHEKRLLNGVVDAASIKTTFADVQAPRETIDALKTLTMLSLVRPEAFTYGVLATDKIPGLLLYGPPGTGKTLLAKAVAKESGATVLEVSGSDVYDMYVGEGEKNVKAIFTLAKKLSPCVVFIDEADAIFGSRGNSGTRTSHRELINQFLREWDGMNDMSAFIMVATNRPFDLDDAVLRRLPRRLLVDLPSEKDREAILRIHLKNESLESSVSIPHIASQTPFYSGSDLKNLSVAAALACVREENDAAAAHAGSEPYKYPAQRTLTRQHFEKAMEEISASISEDMSSLAAIRKFDEKFGDRKGRKKKSSGYGFGTLTETEKSNEDTVRVRAQS